MDDTTSAGFIAGKLIAGLYQSAYIVYTHIHTYAYMDYKPTQIHTLTIHTTQIADCVFSDSTDGAARCILVLLFNAGCNSRTYYGSRTCEVT